jgi:hypothetical protein|tara:strand:- start:764 stop:973 length:210 start_codon:yes stop_codon:yes gene_type:complete
MLGGRLTQRKNVRSPARYRGKRVDVSGFNLQGDDGSGGGFNLLISETGDNIVIESGRTYELDTGEPIVS